jgi:hypothetical protein
MRLIDGMTPAQVQQRAWDVYRTANSNPRDTAAWGERVGVQAVVADMQGLLRRLTHPPEPADRVEMHFNGTTDKFEVWLDGKMKWDHADNMAVKAMAAGLIEELAAADAVRERKGCGDD